MLDFESAVELLKQYGYSSTTTHPYLYQNEDSIGICYQYIDAEYGLLERIKIFKDIESFEDFLKQLDWLKTNGVAKNVRMILDNYETMAPKVMFLRNEKLMVEGEMYEVENFDLREQQRDMMDDVSKVIYESGDLLLVYDEMKSRQLQYLQNTIKLNNSLRQKYYDLQKEVDEYNHNKVERELKLLPEIADSGINESLEIALKDKYNMYIAELPPYQEACEFLKEIWELCKQLELNLKYYDAQKEENDIHNELKIVNQKLELMGKLNDEGRPLFGIDLGGQFRKINKICASESSSISDEWIHEQVDNIEKKYSVFDRLDILNTSDYLREAIQNSNYDDLAIKYTGNGSLKAIKSIKLPLNEVAANLSVQYNSSLSPVEQSILVLYNNHKYRKLCDAILKVENFAEIPIKKLISIVSKTKGYSKIKSIVYDAVKKRLADSSNDSIKNSIFAQFDFSSFDSFMTSMVNALVQLKKINTKMTLNSDINMYLVLDTIEEINNSKFINVTSALNDLLANTKGTKSMIGIALLKANTPVLYSPYFLDIGDVYAKGASLQMQIKEMADFELLVDCSDILIAIDSKHTNVVRYYSTPKVVDDISVVNDIKMSFKTTFCKFAFTSKLAGNVEQNVINQSNVNVPVNTSNDIVSGNAVPVVQTDGNVAVLPVQQPAAPIPPVNKEVISVQEIKQVQEKDKNILPVATNKGESPSVNRPVPQSSNVKNPALARDSVGVSGDNNVVKSDKVNKNVSQQKVQNPLPVNGEKKVVPSNNSVTLDKQSNSVTSQVASVKPSTNVGGHQIPTKPVTALNKEVVKDKVNMVNHTVPSKTSVQSKPSVPVKSNVNSVNTVKEGEVAKQAGVSKLVVPVKQEVPVKTLEPSKSSISVKPNVNQVNTAKQGEVAKQVSVSKPVVPGKPMVPVKASELGKPAIPVNQTSPVVKTEVKREENSNEKIHGPKLVSNVNNKEDNSKVVTKATNDKIINNSGQGEKKQVVVPKIGVALTPSNIVKDNHNVESDKK
ncbi:MAG TPA: hypothetical protein DCE23_08355 [Firmicutes bacterium]|nr:hypothetical protein [Bacillota bacterium]